MNKLSLNDVEWKEFNMIDVFNIVDGYYNKRPPEESDGDIPFLSATQYNNGISGFYKKETILAYDKAGDISNKNIEDRLFDGNCIAITNNGSVGYAFYQSDVFTCSHDVTPIYGKNITINKEIAMFLIPLIIKAGKSFGYAKKWRPKRMRKSKLMLPVDENNGPYWSFMEEYMKQQERQILEITLEYYEEIVLNNLIVTGSLSDVEWAEFKFDEVFTEIRRGKRLVKKDQKEGKMPYISSKGINNGVDNFISNKENVRIYEDCLTIANSGSVGSCFYHQYEFIASDHVTHLKNEKFDKYIYLFMVPIVQRLEEKYSFNREINDTRIRKEKLLLPINDSGEINFEFMRNFMKYMEADRLKKVINVYNKKIDKKLTGGGYN